MSDGLLHPSRFAAEAPDRPAVIEGATGAVLTYGQLEERSCRVAHLLASVGCEPGDHVAVLLENRLEFFEVVWGALRSGLYVTPINWHLSPDEAAYIVEDCGASVLFASAALGEMVPGVPRGFAIGGDLPGFTPYEEAVAAQPATPRAEECEGTWMLYSSGTTGKPKGVKPPRVGEPLGSGGGFVLLVQGLYGADGDSVYLSPAPLYHAAPAGWTTAMHRLGATTVIMDRFDPVEVLRLVERYRVTHAQFVPTHLVRMLRVPEDERARYDLSSLRMAVHAAAPCPPEVKRAAIEWLGGRSSTSTTRAARAPASAPSTPRSGWPTPAPSAARCWAPCTSSAPTATRSRWARRARCGSSPGRASSTTVIRRRPPPPSTTGAGARSATSGASTRTATCT